VITVGIKAPASLFTTLFTSVTKASPYPGQVASLFSSDTLYGRLGGLVLDHSLSMPGVDLPVQYWDKKGILWTLKCV